MPASSATCWLASPPATIRPEAADMLRPAAIVLLLAMNLAAAEQPPLRVACVGDSITFGDRIADRAAQSYPAVLQQLSAGRYLTGNFGVNGATALQGTGRCWLDTGAYREALVFAPDRVVVMLGINDLAFPEFQPRFPDNLRDIVTRFQQLPSAPRVFLCTLTPIAPPESQVQANHAIQERMNPAIRSVAAETGSQVIDVSAVYPNRLELLPDGLHPSPEGAALIARTVLAALDSLTSTAPQILPAPAAGPVDISVRNEALAARARAEQWLQGHLAAAALPPLAAPADSAPLLPLLAGEPAATDESLFVACARLAAALARDGRETVFLPSGQPVAWRTALLHQLVQNQKIDARGGGYWSADGTDDARDTAAALQALAAALGE